MQSYFGEGHKLMKRVMLEIVSIPTPPSFDKGTDREAYARGMVQELEDHAHDQESVPARMNELANIVRKWMDPVFVFHKIDWRLSFTYRNGAAIWRVFLTDDDQVRFKQLEPVLDAALRTPSGICACQAVEGVEHFHDEAYAAA